MRVRVPSFAKLNLDLRVLGKRADGYHELRTIFQTISLKDSLRIEFDLAKRSQIDLVSSVEIPDNLIVRSAKIVLDHLKIKAWVRFALDKQIPMGAGLGGGSSNAAAVLIALPALAGKPISHAELSALAESLGSDVPFFLRGGTALALGKGTEIYPLPDPPQHHLLVVFTGLHVSTTEAYAALGRAVTTPLTSGHESPILREFQSIAWTLKSSALELLPLKNDFEPVVFKIHPELAAVARKLRRLGANPAMMTGSGSAIFGIFERGLDARQAAGAFREARIFPARFVNRRQYQAFWRRTLGPAARASCFGNGF